MIMSKPFADPNLDAPPDIDRLLGAFFHSELPAPWPKLSLPLRPRHSLHRRSDQDMEVRRT